jgi:hypothetical protein
MAGLQHASTAQRRVGTATLGREALKLRMDGKRTPDLVVVEAELAGL